MTCVLRIFTAVLHENTKIHIAYIVFLNVGAILMLMLNLALARRLMRAKFPSLGFHAVCSVLFWGLSALCILAMIIDLVVIIQTFFTVDNYTKSFDRKVQVYAVTTFAVIAFIPLHSPLPHSSGRILSRGSSHTIDPSREQASFLAPHRLPA